MVQLYFHIKTCCIINNQKIITEHSCDSCDRCNSYPLLQVTQYSYSCDSLILWIFLPVKQYIRLWQLEQRADITGNAIYIQHDSWFLLTMTQHTYSCDSSAIVSCYYEWRNTDAAETASTVGSFYRWQKTYTTLARIADSCNSWLLLPVTQYIHSCDSCDS